VRQRHVREVRQVRDVVRVDAVAQLVRRRVVEAGNEHARGDPLLDVDHVVREAAAVREAGHVARQHAETARPRSGAMARFKRSISHGTWFAFAGLLSPSTPVRNTATRSLRGVGGAGMP
jgi:hypothetical protein